MQNADLVARQLFKSMERGGPPKELATLISEEVARGNLEPIVTLSSEYYAVRKQLELTAGKTGTQLLQHATDMFHRR